MRKFKNEDVITLAKRWTVVQQGVKSWKDTLDLLPELSEAVSEKISDLQQLLTEIEMELGRRMPPVPWKPESWPDPQRPGYPANPTIPNVHVLIHRDGRKSPLKWSPTGEVWGGETKETPDEIAANHAYCSQI